MTLSQIKKKKIFAPKRKVLIFQGMGGGSGGGNQDT